MCLALYELSTHFHIEWKSVAFVVLNGRLFICWTIAYSNILPLDVFQLNSCRAYIIIVVCS
jgi:hypothetical protein